MIVNCINKQTTRNYFNVLLSTIYLNNSKTLTSSSVQSCTNLFINSYNKTTTNNNPNYIIKNYARKPSPKQDDGVEKISDRAIRREKHYDKLLTLPGRNLKQTLRVLRDNPLDILKKVKDESMPEFLEITTTTTDTDNNNTNNTNNISTTNTNTTKIKNQIPDQLTEIESSYDNIYLIDCLSKINWAIHLIKKEKLIGLDIEAIEMGKNGEISMIQISTPTNGRVFLFDLITIDSNIVFKHGLQEILSSKKILKVVHDCRRDSEILYHRYQVELQHVYDIQIAHALLQKKKHGNVPIRRYGFNELIDVYTDRKYSENIVDIKFRVKQQLELEKTIWSKRPLSKLFIDYASLDCAILLPIYYQIKPLLVSNFDRRFLKAHFHEQLTYFKDSIRQLYPKNLI